MTISTPVVNLPNYYVDGLLLGWQSATVIRVSPGQARDSTNRNDIYLNDLTLVNVATQGAGGLDQGTLANISHNAFYAVYVIGSSFANIPGESNSNVTSSALLSLNHVQPLLPFGYDMFVRVGYVLTDNSGDILEFWQEGPSDSTARKMWYDSPLLVLNDGTSATFVGFSVGSAVPLTTITNVTLQVSLTPTAAGDSVGFRVAGSLATDPIAEVSGDVLAVDHIDNIDMISIGVGSPLVPTIEYKVAGTVDVYVAAYIDQL